MSVNLEYLDRAFPFRNYPLVILATLPKEA